MTAVINFKTTYKGDAPTHWVMLAPSVAESDKCATWHRVEKLRPYETTDDSVMGSPSYQAMSARWEIIEPKLTAYLQGAEIPEDGTPLGAWGGLTSEQADVFRGFKIRTVEEVAALRDTDIQRIPLPNARKLKGLATAFLENKDASAAQAELADMRAQMAAMQEALEAQNKPKRGRPPKSEQDEAA